MEKEVVLALLIIMILILPTGVHAVGSGEGGTTSNDYDANTASGATSNSEIDCEDFSVHKTRRERIECRINPENKDRIRVTEQSKIHESCRRLASATDAQRISKENCRKLYSELSTSKCYEKQGRDKLRCFKRISGLGTAAVSGNIDKTAIRKLVVAYLYQLEEWIEEAVEDGNIGEEKAAELIDFIVEIKEDIMNGETKDVVKPKIIRLRNQLNEIKSSLP
jgi:hypothetical protein